MYCGVCAKTNESVKPVLKKGDNKYLCSQCLKAGLYMQPFYLVPMLKGKGFNLFNKKEFIEWYPSRKKAEKALFERI